MINKNMNNEPTISDVLEAVNNFSTRVDERFDRIEGRLDGVEGRLDRVDGRFDKVDERFGSLESDVAHIKNVMVTKEYLDDKLADLKGDLVLLTRKEDKKLKMLIQILEKRRLISPEEVKQIVAMEPFPEMV